MSDYKTVNWVAIPLEVEMLSDRKLVDELRAHTPNKVVDELDALSKRLPKL